MNRIKHFADLDSETSWYDPYRSHIDYNHMNENEYEYLEEFWVEDRAKEYGEYSENLDAYDISKEQIQEINHNW